MSVLEVQNITKKYGNYVAVDNVSFNVEAGRVYGMLGPNGAGKTSTIRMIMNILIPDSGTIKLFDQTMTDKLKSRIGYLPEERGLYQKMKITDMMVFLGELHGLKHKDALQKCHLWLDKMKLTDKKDKKVEELSKGMQQKLQIIGTMMHDPELIIFDEPFSGLDPVNVNLVKDTMVELRNQGKAIVLSTHMMDAAEKLCDDILMIDKGIKVLDGSLDHILDEHGKNSVQIEFKGDDSAFNNISFIKKINRFPNYVAIEIQDGKNTNDLLKELLDKIDIQNVKSQRSSLHEIFVEQAGENNE